MSLTNAEKQAAHRRKMKAEGYTARLIWVKADEPTPNASAAPVKKYEDAGTLAQAEFLKRMEAKISGRSEAEQFYFFEKLVNIIAKTEIEDNSGYVTIALQDAQKKAKKLNKVTK